MTNCCGWNDIAPPIWAIGALSNRCAVVNDFVGEPMKMIEPMVSKTLKKVRVFAGLRERESEREICKGKGCKSAKIPG